VTAPVPVLGWDADRPTWLAARRHGLGASDVAAVLGFSTYRSPWEVWRDKTSRELPDDHGSDAAQLGTDLEPYLLTSAERLTGDTVTRTDHQLYAHPHHPWRLCSPDAHLPWQGAGVQLKTAGLASGHGTPTGWDDDSTPLSYELQCRWEMHVMAWTRVELVALVANRGLIRRTITRDVALERELITQVGAWWQKHVVQGVEPAVGEADNVLLAALYPRPELGEKVVLSADGVDAWTGYRRAQQAEARAKREKEAYGARLKHELGTAELGQTADGTLLCAWSERKARVDWQRIAVDVSETAKVVLPDPETYRGKPSRSLQVKDPA